MFLRLVPFAQVPLAISFVYAGSLRGTGDTFYVFIVTLVGDTGGVVMGGCRMAAPLPVAVWGVFLIDWYFRGAAFAWRYHRRDLHSVVV